MLQASPHDLGHDSDKVFLSHHPARSISFSSMAVGYMMPNGNGIGGPLIGVGKYIAQGLTNLNKETGEGHPALDWTFGAHGMVVEANPETGEYRVLRIASAFDVGKAVNPELVRGQAIGGMMQGLGTAMCEGYIYDKEGRLLNPSFTDNKIPTAKDLPRRGRVFCRRDGTDRRSLRSAGSWRAFHDIRGRRARERFAESHRRRYPPYAHSVRGCLAGTAEQKANRQLDNQVSARLMQVRE